MDGLILVNKPQGLTSHDVVVEVRKIHHIQKAGHCGTLDPLATGLILVTIRKATKLFPFLSSEDKEYCGEFRLGYSTDTYDSTGRPTSPEQTALPDKEGVIQAMKKFEGGILQAPPPYSAKKYKGKPLYELARQNKEFELRPNPVFIHYFLLTAFHPPFLEFKVHCSSGTYIRSLAHDLGHNLGCGAHLTKLTRIQVGSFHLRDSFGLEDIKALHQTGRTEKYLVPLEALLSDLPKIILTEKGVSLARNGNTIFPEDISKIILDSSSSAATGRKGENLFRMFSFEGRFLALAKKVAERNCFHPFLVMDS